MIETVLNTADDWGAGVLITRFEVPGGFMYVYRTNTRNGEYGLTSSFVPVLPSPLDIGGHPHSTPIRDAPIE